MKTKIVRHKDAGHEFGLRVSVDASRATPRSAFLPVRRVLA
jgi:hypothetical protein